MDGHIFFNDGNLWVTSNSFVNGTDSFAISAIVSAAVKKSRPFLGPSIAVGALGLLLALFYPYLGIALLSATLMYWLSRKTLYRLVLQIDGKEVCALKSEDGKRLNQIYGAIVKAIILSKTQGTVPASLLDE